jgi:hypothetical protein
MSAFIPPIPTGPAYCRLYTGTSGAVFPPPAGELAFQAVQRTGARRGITIDRETAEQIAKAVLRASDTYAQVEVAVTDDVYDDLVRDPGHFASVRKRMRRQLAVEALEDGLLLTRLPHEIIDRPPAPEGWYKRRIRLIAPARKATEPPADAPAAGP